MPLDLTKPFTTTENESTNQTDHPPTCYTHCGNTGNTGRSKQSMKLGTTGLQQAYKSLLTPKEKLGALHKKIGYSRWKPARGIYSQPV